jgi:hypothetical protein
MFELIQSFLMIALTTAGLVVYAIVLGRREDRERESFKPRPASRKPVMPILDPDAHLGTRGVD